MKTIDLHDVRHSKVEEKLMKFINYRLPLEVPFRIITGKSNYMHTLVTNLLAKNELYWRYESYNNTGSLIIMDVQAPGYN